MDDGKFFGISFISAICVNSMYNKTVYPMVANSNSSSALSKDSHNGYIFVVKYLFNIEQCAFLPMTLKSEKLIICVLKIKHIIYSYKKKHLKMINLTYEQLSFYQSEIFVNC